MVVIRSWMFAKENVSRKNHFPSSELESVPSEDDLQNGIFSFSLLELALDFKPIYKPTCFPW